LQEKTDISLSFPAAHITCTTTNGAFKSNFARQVAKFQVKYPDQQVTKRPFSRIFTDIFEVSCSVETVKNSFRATGIWLINRLSVDHALFDPARIYMNADIDFKVASATESVAFTPSIESDLPSLIEKVVCKEINPGVVACQPSTLQGNKDVVVHSSPLGCSTDVDVNAAKKQYTGDISSNLSCVESLGRYIRIEKKCVLKQVCRGIRRSWRCRIFCMEIAAP
jgi:hypothetical protein